MPAYNAEDTITRSILSVWMQTHQNWKIIVLDDMSTDSTVKTVKGRNTGAVITPNRGVLLLLLRIVISVAE